MHPIPWLGRPWRAPRTRWPDMELITLQREDGHDVVIDHDGARWAVLSTRRTTYNGRPAMHVKAMRAGEVVDFYAGVPHDEPTR